MVLIPIQYLVDYLRHPGTDAIKSSVTNTVAINYPVFKQHSIIPISCHRKPCIHNIKRLTQYSQYITIKLYMYMNVLRKKKQLEIEGRAGHNYVYQ